jgi:hypothetical protein
MTNHLNNRKSWIPSFIAALTTICALTSAEANPLLMVTQSQNLVLGQSVHSPAQSCLAIVQANVSRGSGVYWLTTGTTPYRAYCDMTSGNAGWTLVMRMANNSTFSYNSSYWTDINLLDEDTTVSLSPGLNANGKFQSFLAVTGTQIRGCKGDQTGGCLFMNLSSTMSPATLFAGASQSGGGTLSRSSLDALFGTINIEPHCNLTGTNHIGPNARHGRVRLGVLANNENDCLSPDSAIGWGLKMTDSESCGAGRADWAGAGHLCIQGTLWIK